MYTENVISKEELVEYLRLNDNKIKDVHIKKTQVNEKLRECANEDCVFKSIKSSKMY